MIIHAKRTAFLSIRLDTFDAALNYAQFRLVRVIPLLAKECHCIPEYELRQVKSYMVLFCSDRNVLENINPVNELDSKPKLIEVNQCRNIK